MKRLVDLSVARLLLIITAPLLAIIAIVIKVESHGPILYRRRCVGQNGQCFDLIRFRTIVETSAYRSVDEWLTPAGRFIRNYSLDELPILFNVLWGDMSIIGPRPTEPRFVDWADPAWQQILAVRPGVISYAILRLGRNYNASSQPLRNRLELEYIQQQSTLFDLRVLRKATQALVASRGNVKARGKPTIGSDDGTEAG